jgi:hypothetical protein
MDQGEMFDEEEPVRVVKIALVCPRCGARTKAHTVAYGAKGVRKLCGNCQRIEPEGYDAGGRDTPAAPARPAPIVVCLNIHPSTVIGCCTKEMLAAINGAGLIGVLLPGAR